MGTMQKSLRIPEEVGRAIEEEAAARGRDFSAMANELLAEAIKLRRCPGIVFADGPGGRRARVVGTGLDVWEIVATYQSVDRDIERLHRAYDWLGPASIRAALGYYAAYPEEIDRHVARNAAWSPDRLAKQHPSLLPGRR